MKIQTSVRTAFENQLAINSALLVHVDKSMTALKAPRWHYERRLKELESFAVKLESGRVRNPNSLEDFLACTLVVPNTADIKKAISAVEKNFSIKYRRPKKSSETTKSADAFPFDDIRLYVARENDGTLPPEPIDGVIFEVQIKTFLQHAWGIATHDFNYKTDEITWGKDRVVAHLKAALEHVELSLQEANNLASSPSVNLRNSQHTAIANIVAVLKKYWNREDLPENLRGLAQSIYNVANAIKLTPKQLDSILEKQRGAGGLPLNLSPYGVVLSSIISERAAELDEALKKSDKPLILLTPEIAVPDGFPSRDAALKVVTVQSP